MGRLSFCGGDFITVRARVRQDLDNLRQKYLPELSPTVGHAGTDYPWRATVSHAAFAAALGRIAMDLQYGNFKDEVAVRQGKQRAHRYAKVWSALYDMPEDDAEASTVLPWPNEIPAGKKVAYGGVVFDTNGLVLLREPRNHFDGYVWTHPKGRPDPGESPEQTALRETREETGVDARIVAPIPGEYAGGTTINRYFLMQAPSGSGGVAADDPETLAVRWFSIADAEAHIRKTSNPKGRERDLSVLWAALALRSQE